MAAGIKLLEHAMKNHQGDFAGKSPVAWEPFSGRRTPPEIIQRKGNTLYRFSIPAYGDLFSGMYFILDCDPYEETLKLAFELKGEAMWTISGPGLKLLHCLGTAAERARFAAAAKNHVLSVPFRPTFSAATSFAERAIRFVARGEQKNLSMYVDYGLMKPEAHFVSPHAKYGGTYGAKFSRNDATVDFPTYFEWTAPVGDARCQLVGNTPYTAIAVTVYVPDAPCAFIPGAIIEAHADEKRLVPLDEARVVFVVRDVAPMAEVKFVLTPEILANPYARVRVLTVIATHAVSGDGRLEIVRGVAN